MYVCVHMMTTTEARKAMQLDDAKTHPDNRDHRGSFPTFVSRLCSKKMITIIRERERGGVHEICFSCVSEPHDVPF